jgi:hypothetical protein
VIELLNIVLDLPCPAECEIFLAGYFQNQEAVMKFSKDNVSDCEEILSTQEEADTRIILQSMFVNEPGRNEHSL